MKRNPEVQIELLATGRTVDLVEERFDLGIRAGALADSSLVARKLGSVTWFLVATPAYLKKHAVRAAMRCGSRRVARRRARDPSRSPGW